MTFPSQHGFGGPEGLPHGQPTPQQPWVPQPQAAPNWTNPTGQAPQHYGAPGYPVAPYPAPAQYGMQPPLHPYGARMPQLPMAYKDGTAAWLLWFFLGAFGAHHFYLGRTKWGVAYAVGFVLSWVLTIAIIGFLGLIALFVLWIVDAAKMSERVHQYNAYAYGVNRSLGLA